MEKGRQKRLSREVFFTLDHLIGVISRMETLF